MSSCLLFSSQNGIAAVSQQDTLIWNAVNVYFFVDGYLKMKPTFFMYFNGLQSFWEMWANERNIPSFPSLTCGRGGALVQRVLFRRLRSSFGTISGEPDVFLHSSTATGLTRHRHILEIDLVALCLLLMLCFQGNSKKIEVLPKNKTLQTSKYLPNDLQAVVQFCIRPEALLK